MRTARELPRKSPVPMAPPMAIIVIWRVLNSRASPSSLLPWSAIFAIGPIRSDEELTDLLEVQTSFPCAEHKKAMISHGAAQYHIGTRSMSKVFWRHTDRISHRSGQTSAVHYQRSPSSISPRKVISSF